MTDLTNGRALVVGGGSGLGRAAAAAFLLRGAGVVLAGRAAARLERARAGLLALAPGGDIDCLSLDMTDPAATRAAFEDLGPASLDWLIVTAARVSHGPFADTPESQARALFDSKFWGPYALTRAALPALRDGGAVVLCSGVLSRRPGINCVALGAACAAIEGLTRALALELGPRVRVNCVAPGMVDTELHHHLDTDRRQAMFAATGASLPAGRIGHPDEVAAAILLAATNGYMTGHVLDIDGGHRLRQYATRQGGDAAKPPAA